MSITSEAFEEQNNLDASFPVKLLFFPSPFSFPPHYHRGLEIVFITEGQISVEVNNRPYTLTAGDLLFIGSYHIHTYILEESLNNASFYMLILDWTYLEDLKKHDEHYHFLSPALLQTNLITPAAYPQFNLSLTDLFHNMAHEIQCRYDGYQIMISGELYRLLTTVARQLKEDRRQTGDSRQLQKSFDTIRRINRLIYNNYMGEITLESAATAAGYSVYHFSRLFKEVTGFTFHTYLNRFRINMIKEALIATDIPITDLALDHGFNSIKSFNRNFLQMTGQTPSDYRKSNF